MSPASIGVTGEPTTWWCGEAKMEGVLVDSDK